MIVPALEIWAGWIKSRSVMVSMTAGRVVLDQQASGLACARSSAGAFAAGVMLGSVVSNAPPGGAHDGARQSAIRAVKIRWDTAEIRSEAVWPRLTRFGLMGK